MAIPTTRAVFEGSIGRIGYGNYPGGVAINNLDLLYQDASGNVQPATALADQGSVKANQLYLAQNFIGLAGAAKVSTDVATPNFPIITDGIFDMVCASASPSIGNMVAVSENGGANGILNDTVIVVTDPAVSIGQVVMPATSTTLMRCRIKSDLLTNGKSAVRFGEIKQTIAVANFTDDGSTSGHLDLTDKLPAGAIVLGWTFDCTGIFGGDTSATMKAGTSGSTGAFSADTTQSVFTTGKKGSASVVATSFSGTETAVRVTVTSGSDFTLVVTNALGAGTFRLKYAVFGD